ncbi:restriction endonuclease [bacterium]|nr:restriction endonuclease [bacterium]
MEPLPYEITEAMIQCFGRSFHYRDPFASFFRSAGVDRELVDKYSHLPKFRWARSILTDLGNSEDGRLVQRRLLTELCKLRGLPDNDVPDRDAGINALRCLKELAISHDLYVQAEKQQANTRVKRAVDKMSVIQERVNKLDSLRQQFNAGLKSDKRQQAGYSLETIFKELCALFEIEYRKSYKIRNQQIDGSFKFDAFDYLVEARWRSKLPTSQEIGGFKSKVDTKLESTRGLFISVLGFSPEVISEYEGRGAKIVFMSGEDLIYILEGRFDFCDALKLKVSKAAQEGKVYVSLREHL